MKHIKTRKTFLYNGTLSKNTEVNEANIEDIDFSEDAKKEVKYEYGCVMLKMDINDKWKSIIKDIKDEDVYESEEEPGRFGIENEPHSTVLYGLHDDEIEKENIINSIESTKSINLNLTGISIFEQDLYDVLKFDVESEDLVSFNKELTDKYPYSNDYDYVPHVTIAYLKKGTGKNYTESFDEDSIIEYKALSDITYSRVEKGEKEKVSLKLKKVIKESLEENKDIDYSEASFKMDKFMPDDPELMDEFYNISNVEDMILFLYNNADIEKMLQYFDEDQNINGFAEYLIKRNDSKINENRNILDLTQIRSIVKELDFFKDKVNSIETDDEYGDLMSKIEDELGEESTQILDKILGGDLDYSSDYLHYHQNGMTGGDDTGEFLMDIDNIKKYLLTL